MIKNNYLFLFFFLFAIISCTSNHTDKGVEVPVVADRQKINSPLKKGEVITVVTSEQDASQNYALYLPKNYNDSLRFPVILFFDPHASGSYPVAKYQLLAEKFGYVLIGSNNAKNGMQFDQTNVVVNRLMNEATTRYSIDNGQISVAGFSGGAKVALVSAANHPELVSVIYCGAAIPFDNIQQLSPALGFAGERDMNYTEVMSSGLTLGEKKIDHVVVEWKGKHEWPDSLTFEDAFFWSSFNAMRKKTRSVDHKLIDDYLQKKNKLLNDNQNTLARYNVLNQVIAFLNGLTDVSVYRQMIAAIVKTDLFGKELNRQQEILHTEMNMKQNYAQCFQSKDVGWWKDEIARMRSIKSGDQEKMYQRLLGYLSLASYSYSNNAIKQNNFSSAQQFLTVYKLADPENSEQPFLTACMYARQGDQEKAIASLKEAIGMGLKDKVKIETEESFNSLRSNPEFNKLLGRF